MTCFGVWVVAMRVAWRPQLGVPVGGIPCTKPYMSQGPRACNKEKHQPGLGQGPSGEGLEAVLWPLR